MPEDAPPPRRPSSLRLDGPAKVLAELKERVERELAAKLGDLKAISRDESFAAISDESLASIARWAATLARTAATDGINEAFQMGINQGMGVTAADHDRPTRPVAPPPKGT